MKKPCLTGCVHCTHKFDFISALQADFNRQTRGHAFKEEWKLDLIKHNGMWDS